MAFFKNLLNNLKNILDLDLDDEDFSQKNITYTERDLERKFQEGYVAAKKELEAKEASEARKKLEAKKASEARKKLEEDIKKTSEISILLIEDYRDMRDLIAGHLAHLGFDVQTAEDGITGQALAIKYSPDLILLDLMLPNVDGLTLCQRLKRDVRTSNIPTLMMTALGGLKDKVTDLNTGADDYITKPFDLEELHVRIKALLRRTNKIYFNFINQQEILHYGPLTLVPERFEAIWFESPVRLTHLEFELLHCLLQRHDQTVPTGLILKDVWGYEPDNSIKIIRVHIRNLRNKLELDQRKPTYIKTVYGVGYCLELPVGSQVETAKQKFNQARAHLREF